MLPNLFSHYLPLLLFLKLIDRIEVETNYTMHGLNLIFTNIETRYLIMQFLTLNIQVRHIRGKAQLTSMNTHIPSEHKIVPVGRF